MTRIVDGLSKTFTITYLKCHVGILQSIRTLRAGPECCSTICEESTQSSREKKADIHFALDNIAFNYFCIVPYVKKK